MAVDATYCHKALNATCSQLDASVRSVTSPWQPTNCLHSVEERSLLRYERRQKKSPQDMGTVDTMLRLCRRLCIFEVSVESATRCECASPHPGAGTSCFRDPAWQTTSQAVVCDLCTKKFVNREDLHNHHQPGLTPTSRIQSKMQHGHFGMRETQRKCES